MHSCVDIKFDEEKEHSFFEKFVNDIDIIQTCCQELAQCRSNLMNDYNLSLNIFLKTDVFALKYLKNCSVNDNMYNALNTISDCLWKKQTQLGLALNVLYGDRVSRCPTIKEVCEIISTPENTFFQFMLGTVDNHSNIQTLVNNDLYDRNLLKLIYEML
jgi:hypothetical protein